MMNRAFRIQAIVILLLALSLSACGYQFAGAVTRLPPEIRTISLGPIQNMTREVGLEKALIEAIEDEVSSRGRLEVVPVGQGDVALAGVIRAYTTRPVAFSGRDEALQYQASVIVDLELRSRDSGKVFWRARGLREVQDYGAVPGVVVTSSSQFQKSAIKPTDLGRFTDIQLSEGQKREADERLLETLGRDIYNQMMEDF